MQCDAFPGMELAFSGELPYYEAMAAVDLAGGRNFRLIALDGGRFRVEVYKDAGEATGRTEHTERAGRPD